MSSRTFDNSDSSLLLPSKFKVFGWNKNVCNCQDSF